MHSAFVPHVFDEQIFTHSPLIHFSNSAQSIGDRHLSLHFGGVPTSPFAHEQVVFPLFDLHWYVASLSSSTETSSVAISSSSSVAEIQSSNISDVNPIYSAANFIFFREIHVNLQKPIFSWAKEITIKTDIARST